MDLKFSTDYLADFSLLVMASYTTILVNASINPMIFIISLLRKKKSDMDLENRQELPDQPNCKINLTPKSVKPCRSTEEQKFSNVRYSLATYFVHLTYLSQWSFLKYIKLEIGYFILQLIIFNFRLTNQSTRERPLVTGRYKLPMKRCQISYFAST